MLMASTSQAELEPRARCALRSSPVSELRDLLVEQRGDALTLSGTVSSFYHKQLAQEVVWAVCRDSEVELVNVVQVR